MTTMTDQLERLFTPEVLDLGGDGDAYAISGVHLDTRSALVALWAHLFDLGVADEYEHLAADAKVSYRRGYWGDPVTKEHRDDESARFIDVENGVRWTFVRL